MHQRIFDIAVTEVAQFGPPTRLQLTQISVHDAHDEGMDVRRMKVPAGLVHTVSYDSIGSVNTADIVINAVLLANVGLSLFQFDIFRIDPG